MNASGDVLPAALPGARHVLTTGAGEVSYYADGPAGSEAAPLLLVHSVNAAAARLVPALEDKAELARIGHYYATESMLAIDPATGRYDAGATPSFGTETLRDFYRRVLAEGLSRQELGGQGLFRRPRR